MAYVELHAHSAYSFLDGASQPEEMVVRAAELGYEALALTDHDGVYGSLEFAHAAKTFGVRPITGAEVTLADGSHVTLLVRTAAGYANLCRLLTAAHRHTRLPGREAELLPPALDVVLLERNNEGLVCLSGCARYGLAPARSECGGAARARVRPRSVLRRAATSIRARRRPPQRGAARPGGDARCRHRRHRRPARARALARRLAGRARRDPQPHVPRGKRARAPRQPRVDPARARRRARRASRTTGARSSARSSWHVRSSST